MSLLLALLASAVMCPAFAQPASGQPAADVSAAASRADEQLLDAAFRAQFGKDQLSGMKQPLTAEQLADRMTAEQRQGALRKLEELEKSASAAPELEEIGRGYLMLDKRGAGSAEDLLRVAGRLKALDPKNAAAPTLAAHALLELKRYDAAIKASGDAVKLNPNDRNARALQALALAQERPIGDLDTKRFEKAFSSPGVQDQATAGSSNQRGSPRSGLPVRQAARIRPDGIAIPSVSDAGTPRTSRQGSGPLLPLGTAGAGLVMLGVGALASRKEPGDGDGASGGAAASPSLMDRVSGFVANTKQLVEDHPYAAAGIAAGAILITGGLAATALLAGGGELALGAGGAAVLTAPAVEGAPIAGALVQTGGAVAAGSLVLMTRPGSRSKPIQAPVPSATDDTDYSNPARDREYRRAKNYCDRTPELGDDECANLSRLIDHAKQCIELYERWDERWQNGRHDQKVITWRNRLSNLKDEHKRKCTGQ